MGGYGGSIYFTSYVAFLSSGSCPSWLAMVICRILLFMQIRIFPRLQAMLRKLGKAKII